MRQHIHAPGSCLSAHSAQACECRRASSAAVAARKAQHAWSSRSAYNRGQILYRIAEMLEGRREQFINELIETGSNRAQAENELNISIDRLVYYAGWCDKFQQVFSAVNPVESSHFNFSVPEPMGIISIVSAESTGLLGLITSIAPAISGGNTVIVLASTSKPLSAITFGEVLDGDREERSCLHGKPNRPENLEEQPKQI